MLLFQLNFANSAESSWYNNNVIEANIQVIETMYKYISFGYLLSNQENAAQLAAF